MGGDGGQELLHLGIGVLIAAGHQGRAVTGAFLAARDTQAHEVDVLLRAGVVAADRVGIVGVAAVNDDVAGLQVGHQALQHSVHRGTCLDHQQDLPGLFQNGAELLQRGAAGDGVARRLTGLHKDLRGLAAAVVARHGKAVLCQVQCQAPAHDRKARNADLILHGLSSFKKCPCFQPLSNQTK